MACCSDCGALRGSGTFCNKCGMRQGEDQKTRLTSSRRVRWIPSVETELLRAAVSIAEESLNSNVPVEKPIFTMTKMLNKHYGVTRELVRNRVYRKLDGFQVMDVFNRIKGTQRYRVDVKALETLRQRLKVVEAKKDEDGVELFQTISRREPYPAKPKRQGGAPTRAMRPRRSQRTAFSRDLTSSGSSSSAGSSPEYMPHGHPHHHQQQQRRSRAVVPRVTTAPPAPTPAPALPLPPSAAPAPGGLAMMPPSLLTLAAAAAASAQQTPPPPGMHMTPPPLPAALAGMVLPKFSTAAVSSPVGALPFMPTGMPLMPSLSMFAQAQAHAQAASTKQGAPQQQRQQQQQQQHLQMQKGSPTSPTNPHAAAAAAAAAAAVAANPFMLKMMQAGGFPGLQPMAMPAFPPVSPPAVSTWLPQPPPTQ